MAYNMHQGYYEQDKVCYSEQDGYARTGSGMPFLHHNHNHNQQAAVTECETYTAAAGYNATPFLANQGVGVGCYERKEEVRMAQSTGGFLHRRGTGFRRRRVMRRSVSRGEYSSSESDNE